jgi:hypothetical protein
MACEENKLRDKKNFLNEDKKRKLKRGVTSDYLRINLFEMVNLTI